MKKKKTAWKDVDVKKRFYILNISYLYQNLFNRIKTYQDNILII
jgi:hypothetical protein